MEQIELPLAARKEPRTRLAALKRPTAFDLPNWRGEFLIPPAGDLASALEQLLAPEVSRQTLYWGRNYLYLARWFTAAGHLPVVVKQFRHDDLRRRIDRRWKGSKAERSWRTATALVEAGIATPDPILWVDSQKADGLSFYVCRQLTGAVEAREVIKTLNEGEEQRSIFPATVFFDTVADFARDLHKAGFWHRDFSAGNILLTTRSANGRPDAYLVDLNRTRRPGSLTLAQRIRDLCRLPLERRDHQQALLAAYFEGRPSFIAQFLYRISHVAFHGRHRLKRRIRAFASRLGSLFGFRTTHLHLPPPPPMAERRDRAVWDCLSDQPHQHTGRFEKLLVRLSDAPVHGKALVAMASSLPRVISRYRKLQRGLYREPVVFSGIGISVRPHERDPEALLAAVDDLGVQHVLLRLHPWEVEHDAEEALARELHRRGCEVAFALPQRRELVKDLGRWRAAIIELAARFTRYGRHFQIGQAINRSKWGVWSHAEYQQLAGIAAEELRRYPGVELLGPSVIDFEFHQTMAAVNWPGDGVQFDALASLLYVDRRGAPERRQLGFDTVGKVVLARAIAETARHCAPRSWITEVNWPLLEGPNAPAGREVAVGEETAADYLERFYLLALGTGLTERVYWWQLVARGYGLMVDEGDGLRARPGYQALATLLRELDGARFLGPLPAPGGCYLYHFIDRDEREVVAGWSAAGRAEVALPWDAGVIATRTGGRAVPLHRDRLMLQGSVVYCRPR